jgi:hypothetical protein
MVDGRGTYSKILAFHQILMANFTMDDVISYEDIEYLITSTFFYTDQRTYKKFFRLLEMGHFIHRTAKAKRVSSHAIVTKQKSNRVTFEHYRGQGYCWSHYKLGRTPLIVSPPTPPPKKFW